MLCSACVIGRSAITSRSCRRFVGRCRARVGHAAGMSIWVGLADLEARQHHFDVAEQILDETTAKRGDCLELRLARCRLWALPGNAGALAKLAQLDQALPASFSVEQ